MAERIDHARLALANLEHAGSGRVEVQAALAIIAAAQVYATLALVEQQRIANRIALARVAAEADRSAGQHHSAYGLIGPVGIYDNPDTPGGNAVLQDDIREGLGL